MKRDQYDTCIMNCLRACMRPGSGNMAQELTLPESLEDLSDRIIFHGVAGFLYHALKSERITCPNAAGLMEKIKPAAQSIILNNALYEREGKTLTAALERLGISYAMLKGFSLMDDLYGHTGIRPISDLDILVPREQYVMIKQHLLENGYSCQMEADFRGSLEEYETISEEYCTEMQYRKGIGQFQVNLDIHWGVDGLWEGSPLKRLFPIESFPWMKGLETVDTSQWQMAALNRNMQFLHIVSHFALHHQYQGLKWFLDIGLFLEKLGDTLNWACIHETAGTPDTRKMIGIVLRMIGDEFGLCNPGIPHWKDFWSGKALPGEYDFYRKRLLSHSSKNAQYMAYIMLPLRYQDKAKVAGYFLFNPDAISHWRGDETKARRSVWQPVYLVYRAGEAALKKRHQRP